MEQYQEVNEIEERLATTEPVEGPPTTHPPEEPTDLASGETTAPTEEPELNQQPEPETIYAVWVYERFNEIQSELSQDGGNGDSTFEDQPRIDTSRWRPATFEEIMSWKDPVPMFEGLPIYEGTLNLHVGSGGDFKSLTALGGLAKSILSGQPLFGKFKVLRTGKVLIIDEENPKSILKRRLQNLGLMPYVKSGQLVILHYSDFKIDDDSWFNLIQYEIGEIQPAMVTYDSLTRFHNRKENSSTGDMSMVMNKFRQLSDGPWLSWLIHHFNKSENKTARGSSDIVNAVDMEFVNVRNDVNSFTFDTGGKCRVERMLKPLNLEIHGLTGLMSTDPISIVCTGTKGDELEDTILSVMKGQGWLPVYSTQKKAKTVHCLLRDIGIDAKKDKLYSLMKSLHTKQVVSCKPGKVPGVKKEVGLYSRDPEVNLDE